MIRPLIAVVLFVFLIACGGGKDEVVLLPREHFDSMSVSIHLRPPDPVDPEQLEQGGGLRGVTFSIHPLLHEPSVLGLDGSPMEKYATVTRDEMLRIVKVVEGSGWLSTAERYWGRFFSEPKTPPPTDSERYRPRTLEPSACRVKLAWVDGDYRRYIVMSLPWDDSLGEFLRALLDELPDRHIDELISTSERFR